MTDTAGKKYLVVITGPTAVGKTGVSIHIAEKFRTEIISADARQFYREMNTGTAKPTDEELRKVKHHFINNLSVFDDYSAGKFEEDVLSLTGELFKQHHILILTGGSGLYIKAVSEGLDSLPEGDPAIRNKLNKIYKTEGLQSLQALLKKLDNHYFERIDKDNPHRLIRALEVSIASGEPFSSFHQEKNKKRPFKCIKIVLDRERKVLYERINKRVDQMISDGLIEEARGLYEHKDRNALQTVGYKELFDHFDGEYDLQEAIRLIKRNSRRYAKRQLTWLRKDEEAEWFHPDAKEKIIEYINKMINE